MNDVSAAGASLVHRRRSDEAGRAGRRRVLLVAEAVTLAHVARIVALAQSLDPEVFDVCVACDPRYEAVFGDQPFPVKAITTISGDRFFTALAKGSPIYDVATLTGYVQEDFSLIRSFDPDVVVGDFRLSLEVSARLAGVTYVTVTNAYWSPYATIGYPVPDIPLCRVLGPAIAQHLFDLIRPAAFALHARPLNTLRRRFGFASLPLDLRDAYTRADYTMYADVPELVPCANLPVTHRYIGHVAWQPQGALPRWWNELPGDLPIIYVTLGSSGARRLLHLVLEALAPLDVRVMASSAGCVSPAKVPENAHVADYLPGNSAAGTASLVICNGGSPTSYQALAAGKPVIGIASNLDQYLNMSQIDAYGAGMLLRGGQATVAGIRQAVRHVLGTPAFARAADRLASAIAGYPTALFQGEISRIVMQRA